MSRFPGLTRHFNPDAGVRGWLALFLFGACVAALIRLWIAGLLGFALSTFVVRRQGFGLTTAMAGGFLIEAALCIATLYGIRLILRGDQRTPSYWASFLLLSIPATFLFYVCAAYGNAVADGSSLGSSLTDSLLNDGGGRGMITSALWSLYWARSLRVLQTYGRNAFDKPRATTPAPHADVT